MINVCVYRLNHGGRGKGDSETQLHIKTTYCVFLLSNSRYLGGTT